jgi:L,D-transpeptidase catalytic domain
MSRIRMVFSVLLPALVAACAGPDIPSGAGPDYAAAPDSSASSPVLSSEARRVSQMAERNGDRDYLMLDKARGKIFVFQNNRPTFSGAALTGEYPVDYLAPDATQKTFKESEGLKYKVTPAGRYTVSVGFDPAYGDTLDVNEVQGKDWDIAIHKVWLGAPSEHRDARLRSPGTQDKHITYGCIDVDGATMKGLMDRLPDDEATPLYILPQDESLIIKFFQPRSAVTKVSSPTG